MAASKLASTACCQPASWLDLRELTWKLLRSLCLSHEHETKRASDLQHQRPAKEFHAHLLYAGFATYYLYIHIYIYYIHLYKNTVAASVLALPSRLWEPAHWLSHSTMMAASVLAHTHFNYDGSQRAGFAIWTMVASVLAYPLQL